MAYVVLQYCVLAMQTRPQSNPAELPPTKSTAEASGFCLMTRLFGITEEASFTHSPCQGWQQGALQYCCDLSHELIGQHGHHWCL